jgi:hypothetical protein
VTQRGVEDPNANLDELIEAYFADQKILSASTAQRLLDHKPIPKGPEPGYDGRLFDWLAEMLNYGPPDGPEQAWPIILQLIERAPDDNALGMIGSGAVEDLVNRAGAEFADRIFDEAANSRRFRLALRHVWPHQNVPNALLSVIRNSRVVEAE